MLKIGEKVLYGVAGACTVTGICTRRFSEAGEREYYVLSPVHDARTTLYVPVDGETLRSKVKRLLSEEEVEGLIASMPQEKPLWIANEKARQEAYKGVLRRGDRRELIGMTKALYHHRRSWRRPGGGCMRRTSGFSGRRRSCCATSLRRCWGFGRRR